MLRILLVGTLFIIFGMICLVGNCLFIPLILCRLHRFRSVQYMSRDIVHYSWGFFIFLCNKLGYLESRFSNFNFLGKTHTIFIANHPSLLDVVLILSQAKRLNCIVKADLKRNIFLFAAITASGYISNEDEEKLLEKSIETLKSGDNLLIFPEGTRTREKIIFHKAASYIALHGALELIPITINMQPRSLQKHAKWYQTPQKKISFTISAKDSINLSNFYVDKPDPIRVRMLHKQLTNLYEKEFYE